MKVEILSDETIGQAGGFLAIRRLHVVNVRPDGSRSPPYLCDFVVRPKGIDAVVVALYARRGDAIEVLLRHGLRLPLHVGRPAGRLPIAEAERHPFFREVVAGIIENDDVGLDGVRRRAALEVEEEAGFHVAPEAVVFLGAGTFPSPGAMAEKFWLTAVEVDRAAATGVFTGDGSPMEEGAHVEWMELDRAILACVAGELEDAKTEIVLRRLRDRLKEGT
jgi:ADP-ribose pyrophosphatase